MKALVKPASLSDRMKWIHPKVHLRGALEGASAQKVWRTHLWDLRSIYFWGVVGVWLTTLAEVMAPHIIMRAIDTLSQIDVIGKAQAQNRFLNYFFIMIGLYLLQYLGRIAWRVLLAQQAHHVGAKMKSLVWDRSRFLPRIKLERDLRPGDLMNIATGDVNQGRFAYSFTLVMTADMIWLFILTLGAMFWISPKLTLLTLVIVPALPYFLHRLSVLEGKQHDQAQESLSELSDLSSQSVSTIRLQRLTQTGPYWKARLMRSAEKYMKLRKDVVFTGLNFIPVTGVTPILSYIILLFLGIPDVLNGSMSIGSFVAMQSYIFLIQVPLIELGATIAEWQRSFTSLKRVSKVYAEPEAPRLRGGGDSLNPRTTNTPLIETKNLSFQIPETEITLFADLSFKLAAGQRLGILGPVGSGKSSLIQILAGFEDQYQGQVYFGTQEIRSLSHEELRKQISLVPQKSFLFAETLRSNISLDLNLPEDEIWHFLELAGVAEDVRSFSLGLDTRIGEWGVTLSGGQKQRLTLARALARKPQLLLLDDCLSAIDTVTEEKILKALDRELKETALVWVAHRKSTLKYCDQILEMKREP
jgi:ATP-binding cassette, subfamily B, multidrug efflux pump